MLNCLPCWLDFVVCSFGFAFAWNRLVCLITSLVVYLEYGYVICSISLHCFDRLLVLQFCLLSYLGIC